MFSCDDDYSLEGDRCVKSCSFDEIAEKLQEDIPNVFACSQADISNVDILVLHDAGVTNL